MPSKRERLHLALTTMSLSQIGVIGSPFYSASSVVGEALDQVPKGIRALAPEITWGAIKGMRNRLVLGYDLTDGQIVLNIAQNDTKDLAGSIGRLIEKIE